MEATQAATTMIEEGGNAFDAAVSAVFTSMTSEFALTGPAGGGAMLVKTPNADPLVYDFFVNTPRQTTTDNMEFFKAEINFGSSKQFFHIGKGSVAVPGTLAGLIQIHSDLGKLPLSLILQPAVTLAKNGCKMNREQAYVFKILQPIFIHTPEGRQLLCRNEATLKEGEIFKNPDFAFFLNRVIDEGTDFFYKGDIADEIVSLLSEGGLLDKKSLSAYTVEKRKPIITDFYGYKVYSNPPPSAGGSLILFLLKLINKGNAADFSPTHLLHAMAVTNKARQEICKDPNNPELFYALLDKKVFTQFKAALTSELSESSSRPVEPGRGCTTHVSVMDKEGNCASVTTSNGEGSGYIIPNTGIMLNNMLGEEDLNPQGFHNWTKPRRLPTMMSPTLILKENIPEMVVGSGGSNRIRSAIVQVILNYFCQGYSLEESIKAPRMHFEEGILYCEPGIIPFNMTSPPEEVILKEFKNKNLFFGGVNAVTRNAAFSDRRRGGTTVILD